MTKTDTMSYTQTTINVLGNVWSVLFTPTYVSVRKETNNPFKTTGRQFTDLDEAIDHYSSIAMKAALMQLK